MTVAGLKWKNKALDRAMWRRLELEAVEVLLRMLGINPAVIATVKSGGRQVRRTFVPMSTRACGLHSLLSCSVTSQMCVVADSRLVVCQVAGFWGCEAPELAKWVAESRNLLQAVFMVSELCFGGGPTAPLEWVRWSSNLRADELSKRALTIESAQVIWFWDDLTMTSRTRRSICMEASMEHALATQGLLEQAHGPTCGEGVCAAGSVRFWRHWVWARTTQPSTRHLRCLCGNAFNSLYWWRQRRTEVATAETCGMHRKNVLVSCSSISF